MLGNILKLGGASAVIATYYYVAQKNRIRLTNPYLSGLFKLVRQQKPSYAQPLFKLLLSLNLLEQHPQLSAFILQAGFDPQGSYIEQIKNLGFVGIEVGPTSFNASLEEDTDQHLGIMNAIANICSYRNNCKDEKFLIELSIAPNLQILKYTPYLMQQNLIGALNHYIRIQQKSPALLVDAINFSFQRSGCSLPQTGEEVNKMMNRIKQAAEQIVAKQLQQNYPKIAFTRTTTHRYMNWESLLDFIVNKQIH